MTEEEIKKDEMVVEPQKTVYHLKARNGYALENVEIIGTEIWVDCIPVMKKSPDFPDSPVMP